MAFGSKSTLHLHSSKEHFFDLAKQSKMRISSEALVEGLPNKNKNTSEIDLIQHRRRWFIQIPIRARISLLFSLDI
jgi:hypothetical protein